MLFCLRPKQFVLATAIAVLAARAPAGDSTGGKIEFNRDVRPILTENYFRRHGPGKNQRKAKLRLDVREVALECEAFVSCKPGESELIRRINATSDPALAGYGTCKISGGRRPTNWSGSRWSIEPGASDWRSTWPSQKITLAFRPCRK